MIELESIGTVHASRREAVDDTWDSEETSIELDARFPEETLQGLADFSHVEVIFVMHDAKADSPPTRHPRGDTTQPKIGIFAQRNKDRPNRIGLTVARILKIEGRTVRLKGLDAIDGTPVLDLKPWMQVFAPRGEIHEPAWTQVISRNYW